MFVARAAGSSVAGSVIAAASGTSQTSSVSVTKPTGTASGDMMIAIASADSDNASSMTAPSGWTLLTSLDEGSGSFHVKIWTHQAGGSEPSSYSFGSSGLSSDNIVEIVTLRNVTATTASWLYATPATVTNSASPTAPTVSGAASGSVLLCAVTGDSNGVAVTWTAPSGMTMAVQAQSTTYTTQAIATLLNPANPSGTKTFSASANNWTTENQTVWSVVIPHA